MKRIATYKLYLEGVRDKMTPKSEEDIQLAYTNIINSINNVVTDYPDEWHPEFEKIAKLFNVTINDLYLINQESDDKYDILDEYFDELVIDENKIMIPGLVNEDGVLSGEWSCYPNKKLAHWSSETFDDPKAWIFCKKCFTNKTNESIRDKMTPKSDEEIKKAAEHLLPDQLIDMGSKNGYLWAVKKGIDEGGNIHINDNLPLRLACAFGYMDIVKLLLDSGADIHAKTEFPLRAAAYADNTDLVDYLISRGADAKRVSNMYVVTPEDRKINNFFIKYNRDKITNTHTDRLKDMMG